MVGILIAATLIGQQRTLTLHDQTFPWTGQNGYEEYIQVAIALDRPENKAFESYVSYTISPTPKDEPVPARPAGLREGAKAIELYDLEARRFAPLVALIEAGNAKPCRYPNGQIGVVTLFPQLAYLKRFGRILIRSAFLAFARGDSVVGTRLLLDELTLGRNLQPFGEFHFFTSAEIERIGLAALRKHLGQLSVVDVKQVAAWAAKAAEQETPAVQATEVESKAMRTSFEDALRDPVMLGLRNIDGVESSQISPILRSITPQQRNRFYERYLSSADETYKRLNDRLMQPESAWGAAIDLKEPEGNSVGEELLSPLKEVVSEVVATLRSLHFGDPADVLSIAAQLRIQQRLAKIYADVLAFKWTNDRLPSSLGELYGADATDPATRTPYNFEPRSDGTFRISVISPFVGECDLGSPLKGGPAEDPNPVLSLKQSR